MRRLQLILIDSPSESFPEQKLQAKSNSLRLCQADMSAVAMYGDRRNTLLASNIGKACTQRGPVSCRVHCPVEGTVGFPHRCNVAGPLSGLGPDSSAASGRPFVTRDQWSLKIQGLVSFSLVGHLQTLLGCYFSICHGFFMASGGTLSFRIICGQCRLRCLLCFLEQWGSIPHPADMRSYHQKNIRRQFPRNFTTCCFPSRLFAMPHEDGTLLML